MAELKEKAQPGVKAWKNERQTPNYKLEDSTPGGLGSDLCLVTFRFTWV